MIDFAHLVQQVPNHFARAKSMSSPRQSPEVNISFGWRHWVLPGVVCVGVFAGLALAWHAASWVPENRGNAVRPAAVSAKPAQSVVRSAPLAHVEPIPVQPNEIVYAQTEAAVTATTVAPSSSDPAIRPPAPKAATIVKRAPAKAPLVRSAADIATELAAVPEIGLDTFNMTPADFLARKDIVHPTLALFDSRADLGHMPLARGLDCQASVESARELRRSSKLIREALAPLVSSGEAITSAKKQQTILATPLTVVAAAAEVRPDLLVLMTGGEGDVIRQLVIETLSGGTSPAAVQALAARAVFDPAPGLRRLAARKLKAHAAADARPILLAALQFPWPAAADHAAEALIATDDRGAVPQLVSLLDAPDPARPGLGDDGTPVVRELVRMNHMRSCQLCHAPSYDASDTIRADVPSSDRPLPPPLSLAAYSNGTGKCGTGRPRITTAVRVDIAYMRPAFSTLLPVENPGPWPKTQRYDFVVRTRSVHTWEDASPSTTFPQKEAVLRALRALTDKDFGDAAADWRTGLRDNPQMAADLNLAKAR
jgi:hypothetical protein